MTSKQPKQEGTQAIRRAALVLKQIAGSAGRKSSLRQLSDATGLSRSTAHRIVKCLVEEHLLDYDQTTRKYAIGGLVFELGLSVAARQQETLHWRPLIEKLAKQCGTTAYLIARSGYDTVCLYKAEGASVLRAIPVEVGQRRPLGVGAAATALLATMSDADIDQALTAIAPQLPDISRLTVDQVRHHVDETRKSGMCESWGFVADGVYGLGMTLPSRSRPATMAVSIAAHQSFATPENIADWKNHFGELHRQAAEFEENTPVKSAPGISDPLARSRDSETGVVP